MVLIYWNYFLLYTISQYIKHLHFTSKVEQDFDFKARNLR